MLGLGASTILLAVDARHSQQNSRVRASSLGVLYTHKITDGKSTTGRRGNETSIKEKGKEQRKRVERKKKVKVKKSTKITGR